MAATSCREEAERDPSRRDLWLQAAERWMSLAGETVVAAISLERTEGDMIETVSVVPANSTFLSGMSPDGPVQLHANEGLIVARC
ncbi:MULTISPECIES: hypothetical protein [unclassified Bradyrhizobium]|uniref:hypothetical protein n=1 Tax=unclassified Bradyrhizobium TaxID=2631580 RepID=UPI0029168522|nr:MULTISPECIES: hypothetical protein [unclassified Bradyrhizobium]